MCCTGRNIRRRPDLGVCAAEAPQTPSGLMHGSPEPPPRGSSSMFDCTLQPPSERETPASMTGARHLAQRLLSVAIRRRFSAMHTSFHSAVTRCRPLILNCLNPRTFLTHPLGGSAIHFRFR